MSQDSLSRLDGLLAMSLILLIVLYSVRSFNFSEPPFEDAAMLMRYSQHLAQGHGIVWNIGKKPVDGATDFLFMVLLALLAKAGITLEFSVHLIGFFSHILTVLFVYLAIRKFHRSSPWLAWISAAYLAIGPGLSYIEVCFGTPLFALLACITWCFAIKLLKDIDFHTTSLLFALSALIMGLIRPEGVFLGFFILLSIVYMKGFKKSRRVILFFLATFALLGGIYFFWRWHYFGYPLPNPFYKKGGGLIYLGSIKQSIYNFIYLSFPFTLIFIYAMLISTLSLLSKSGLVKRIKKTFPSIDLRSHLALGSLDFLFIEITKTTIFSSIPIIGFILLWGLLSDEMNYLSRFQYAILPIVLISWPPLWETLCKLWKIPKLNDLDINLRTASALWVAICCIGILGYPLIRYSQKFVPNYHDGRYDVAIMLSDYKHNNYTIATTEAGLLPFYSQWKAIDTWGLNDQWIAHNGQITENYLKSYNPEIIMFHAGFSPMVPPSKANRTSSVSWFLMVMTLKDYAEKNGYILAAAFGDSPYNTHYYYVRPDFPKSMEITKRIRNIDYCWYITGKKSINYAMIESLPQSVAASSSVHVHRL